jgi:hypothetical protein
MWSGTRILVGTVVTVLVASAPVVASAASRGQGPQAHAAAGRIAYGGFTAQNWPISIETSRDRREVARVGMGFELKCTSGIRVDLDRYSNIVLHRNRRFSASYSNSRSTLPDGSYFLYGGSVSGRMSRSHTSISGTVNLNYTRYTPAGVLTDTCNSGQVKYKVK